MGYFSNGEEGRRFEAQFCERCAHWQLDDQSDTYGCPVMDVHQLFNYGQEGETEEILAYLIERTEDGLGNECKLFLPSVLPS
jgi:hypothetical protein